MEMDRWSLKPALLSVVTVSVLELLCQLPGLVSFILIPLSLVGFGIATVVILMVAIYRFIKKRSRGGASVLLMLLLPVLLWRPIHRLANLEHLGLTVGMGLGQLGRSMESSNDLVVYDWSVGFAGGPNTFLIRDGSDEIVRPMSQHTHSPGPDRGFEEECAGKVEHLAGHYYICTL